MADVKILASPDFEEQTATVVPLLDSTLLGIRSKRQAEGERIDLKDQLDTVDVQTEEDIRSLLGAAGWGLLGSVMLGPAGLVLGALWGARSQKEICFAAHLKDGRKFLGLTDAATFQRFKAATFR
jgi:hypothetical protein